MSLLPKKCIFGLILLVTTFQYQMAADILSLVKPAKDLTPAIFAKAQPNDLLCMVSKPDNPCDKAAQRGGIAALLECAGRIVSRILDSGHHKNYLCEYRDYDSGNFSDVNYTNEFQWLDASYEQLSAWLTSESKAEIGDDGMYFVFRKNEFNSVMAPSICVKSTRNKGLEFGYELVSDNGKKHCDTFVGAVYYSPFIVVNDESLQ